MFDISVIIVSYNTLRFTLEAIESVIKEHSKYNKEIIVVDNGSTDGSVEQLKILFKSKKIVLIANKQNLGFARANNQAIKISRGKYLLLLNSDARVEKGSIGILVEFAKSHKDAGAVVPRLINKDGSIQESVFNLPTVAVAIRQYWFGNKGLMEKFYPHGISPIEVESAVMAAFLITPDALKKVGILNDKYFMFFEDLDYCRRIRQKGLKIYYIPRARVMHFHGESGKKITDADNQWRRLVPSSKIYHGIVKHYLIFFVMWSSQKWNKYILGK